MNVRTWKKHVVYQNQNMHGKTAVFAPT